MKLIVQIPCYNEEQTIEETLEDIPDEIPGVDTIETLVIDDGCTDRTVEIANEFGVDHVVGFSRNRGLARAFQLGIRKCLEKGADLIINTDGDHSFRGDEMPELLEPILDEEAEIVIGERKGENKAEFSWSKRLLHWIGSAVVRQLSGTDIPDVTCGFRAYTREAALRLNVVSRFTYTLETILQAGIENLPMTSVPVQTNPSKRPSRLFQSNLHYVRNAVKSIIRIFVMYRPLRFFGTIGTFVFSTGVIVGSYHLFVRLQGIGEEHFQSLILSAVLLIVGFIVMVQALISDLISSNRRLIQEHLFLLRKESFDEEK